MAKKEYFTFLSSDKKTEIHGVTWTPESGEYTAVLQICHGMTEYVERYQEFAAYMTEHGYLVVGHDHLGHGDSVRSREDWGYIADERGEQYMIADIHKVRKITQRENPGLPYFILGHSMGSYLLRKYITRYGEGLSGAIIVGTGSVPDVVLKTGMRTAECIALLKGWRHRSRLMEKLVFSGSFRTYFCFGSTTGALASKITSYFTIPSFMVASSSADPMMFRFVRFFDTSISSLIVSGSIYLLAISSSDTSLYSETTALRIHARNSRSFMMTLQDASCFTCSGVFIAL